MKEEILNVVESELFYGVDDGVMPVNETSNLVTKIPTFTGNIDPRVMPINNGRKWDEPFDIEIHGFELVPHKTDMEDFLDPKELKEKYYKELKTLVKQHVGAIDVYIFDHTLRTGDDEKRKKADAVMAQLLLEE